MLYLTCTTINSVDLAYCTLSRAKDWVSVDCGTRPINCISADTLHHHFKVGLYKCALMLLHINSKHYIPFKRIILYMCFNIFT